MKNLIIVIALSLMSNFVYSQNCTFGVYLNSYKNTSKKISFIKRKNLTFFIKTDSCLCFGNNFKFFVKNNLNKWGKLVKSEITENTKHFYLMVDENHTFELFVEKDKVVITEIKNGKQKVFVSKNFSTEWVI